jgi:hypothetical protein
MARMALVWTLNAAVAAVCYFWVHSTMLG